MVGKALNVQIPGPASPPKRAQGELRPETATSLLTIAAAIVFGCTEAGVFRLGSDVGCCDASISELAGCWRCERFLNTIDDWLGCSDIGVVYSDWVTVGVSERTSRPANLSASFSRTEKRFASFGPVIDDGPRLIDWLTFSGGSPTVFRGTWPEERPVKSIETGARLLFSVGFRLDDHGFFFGLDTVARAFGL